MINISESSRLTGDALLEADLFKEELAARCTGYPPERRGSSSSKSSHTSKRLTISSPTNLDNNFPLCIQSLVLVTTLEEKINGVWISLYGRC